MIPISKPLIAKNAQKYLLKCLQTSWISGAGPLVEQFEKDFAKFIGTRYAVACNSGTSAIHLALASLEIGEGDQVIVPSFTMISTVLPIIYTGATPVLVDVDKTTGNIDPNLIEQKITSRTKAIMPVHFNGHPAQMEQITKIAKKHQLAVIEDAAEAHGALVKDRLGWKKVGGVGDLGCFSLYANKIVTAGEGGMVTTNSQRLAKRIKSLRNLARTEKRHFYHQEIAFNYKLSSLQSALGIAQLEEVESIIKKKLAIASLYNKLLGQNGFLILPVQENYAKSVYWHYGIRLRPNSPKKRLQLENFLTSQGIETRVFFTPIHQQPVFIKKGSFKNEDYPVSEQLAQTGLNLPSGPDINQQQIELVCALINKFLQ